MDKARTSYLADLGDCLRGCRPTERNENFATLLTQLDNVPSTPEPQKVLRDQWADPLFH